MQAAWGSPSIPSTQHLCSREHRHAHSPSHNWRSRQHSSAGSGRSAHAARPAVAAWWRALRILCALCKCQATPAGQDGDMSANRMLPTSARHSMHQCGLPPVPWPALLCLFPRVLTPAAHDGMLSLQGPPRSAVSCFCCDAGRPLQVSVPLQVTLAACWRWEHQGQAATCSALQSSSRHKSAAQSAPA